MRISLYFINWNDSFYIPFIAKHYSFCDKIVMYDHYSTDDSSKIATSFGIEVRKFGQRGILNDQHYLDVKNNCWKEERGKSDYVIVCDADEFLSIPKGTLTASCPTMTGYNMISNKLPVKSIMEINTGSEDENYAKQIIFNPDKISEINYVHGCHKNNKVGEITTGDPLSLYHYRMIGGVDLIIKRHEEYRKRLSSFNKKHNMGHHYMHADNQKRIEWDYLQSKAVQLW
jgi:hypothetical protein